MGDLVFGLFGHEVPRTVRNFVELSRRKQRGEGYTGSPLHAVYPRLVIHGGDITNHDGTGGKSIYGAPFRAENHDLEAEPYCLAMNPAVLH
jgi:peptidylprolyl isomerase